MSAVPFMTPPKPLSTTPAAITSGGTNAATATPILAVVNYVNSLTDSGAGVLLLPAVQGVHVSDSGANDSGIGENDDIGPSYAEWNATAVSIMNKGPNSCQIYVQPGDSAPAITTIPADGHMYTFKDLSQGSWQVQKEF
jgi:hypothetical protein